MSQPEFDEIFNNKESRSMFSNNPAKEIVKYSLQVARDRINTMRVSNRNYPEVYIDIVYSGAVNASATMNKTTNKYFIGINFGTLIIMQDVFYRILSSKNTFLDVGNASNEKDLEKIYNLQVTDLETFVLNRPGEMMVFPQDPIRVFLGQTLMSMVIEFLAYHEYAHIISGHVGYLKTVKPNSNLNEIEQDLQPGYPLDTITLQTFEVDADYIAMESAMRYMTILISNPQQVDPRLQSFYRDWLIALRYWCFAVYTFFKIVGHKEKSSTTSFDFPHPPPSVRAGLVQTHLVDRFKNSKIGINLDELHQTCIETWAEVDRAFTVVSLSEYDGFEANFAASDISLEFLNRLGENCEKIRSSLKPFSFL